MHLSIKHNNHDVKEVVNRVINYFKSYAANASHILLSVQEFNHDLILWFCRDFLSFNAVDKNGFKGCMSKHFPTLQLPTTETIWWQSSVGLIFSFEEAN